MSDNKTGELDFTEAGAVLAEALGQVELSSAQSNLLLKIMGPSVGIYLSPLSDRKFPPPSTINKQLRSFASATEKLRRAVDEMHPWTAKYIGDALLFLDDDEQLNGPLFALLRLTHDWTHVRPTDQSRSKLEQCLGSPGLLAAATERALEDQFFASENAAQPGPHNWRFAHFAIDVGHIFWRLTGKQPRASIDPVSQRLAGYFGRFAVAVFKVVDPEEMARPGFADRLRRVEHPQWRDTENIS